MNVASGDNVYKALLENAVTLSTIPVVVKAFDLKDKPKSKKDDTANKLRNEMHAADRIRSPHVVRYIAVGRCRYPDYPGCPEFLTLVMKQEDMKLAQYLQELEELDEVQYANRTRPLYQQLIKAYQAIHGAGIIHLDVKPDNTLVSYSPSGEAVVKVCDFGFSTFHESLHEAKPVSFLPEIGPHSSLCWLTL
jgi:serine/threonine protein kinase